MRHHLLPILLMVSCLAHPADPPSWITDAGREQAFPASTWVVGWASETVSPERDQAKCLEIVTTGAQAELARSIRVRITADTESRQRAVTTGTDERFASSFADTSRATSDVTLTGRRLETWFDARSGRAQAVSAIERRAIASQARDRAATILAAAASAAEAARTQEAEHPGDALGQWGRVLVQVRSAGDDLALARSFGSGDAAAQAACEALHARANEALARLAGRPVMTVDDLAFVLALQLGRGAGDTKPRALVPTCTVAASRMSSQFGRYLGQALANQLAGAAGWTVVVPAAGPARAAAVAAGAEVVVLGATWERPEGVRVVAMAHRLADGQVLATAEATLPGAALTASGLSPRPQNAAAALADAQQFREQEIVGDAMRVELWTSKGDEAPVYTAGETARIFVRVDRPAHLRVVDHMADGRRVLLIDDLFIDQSKVNLAYQLPDQFEISAPFGAETLQANACTAPFPHLETRIEDGYPVITEGLASANAKSRGFARRDPAQLPPEAAECRVVVTTLAKP